MPASRSLNGAIAGGIAAAVWAAQQPLDKRVFGVEYDDVELLGKAVTRGSEWPAVGLALHIGNGAAFGALYAQLRPFLFGPPVLRAVTAAMIENFASWPLINLAEEHHPAGRELPKVAGNPRALAQATWRHALFGVLLGVIEQRLNRRREAEPPFVPVSSNGHGNIEHAATAAA
ncbi:MAG TPA: hypothetical protein VFL87_04810 [Thermoleophilaceae bacterium]|nr:hypothetical protein [Thermoleophilaceae bacterium]